MKSLVESLLDQDFDIDIEPIKYPEKFPWSNIDNAEVRKLYNDLKKAVQDVNNTIQSAAAGAGATEIIRLIEKFKGTREWMIHNMESMVQSFTKISKSVQYPDQKEVRFTKNIIVLIDTINNKYPSLLQKALTTWFTTDRNNNLGLRIFVQDEDVDQASASKVARLPYVKSAKYEPSAETDGESILNIILK